MLSRILLSRVLLAILCTASSLPAADLLPFPAGKDHLWNRLHRQLYARERPNSQPWYHENLEPNFTPRAKFLVEGESHARAIALLEEFANPQTKHLDDNTARAVLQRDLWAVFAATNEPDLAQQTERQKLHRQLAAAIYRLALTEREIASLPDNLADVARSERFPPSFNAADPTQPFLPRDLFAADGPWVLVTNRLRPDASAAPQHDQATNGRSTFLLLVRLPAGRQATLAYLSTLAQKQIGRDELPQFPTGTQVALVRRLNLLDRTGQVHVSPMTESVQLRVYDDLKKPQMLEFVLRRSALSSEPGKSLEPTPRDEENPFDLGILGLAPRANRDPIEEPETRLPAGVNVLKSCVHCHAGPGIFGFQSLYVDHFDQPPLAPGKLGEQLTAAARRANQADSVKYLQRFAPLTRSSGN